VEPEPEVVEQLEIPLGSAARRRVWKLPALNLLARSSAQEVDQRLVEEAGRVLEAALAAHGVETRLVGMTVGPTVTRYELELAPGVKVARVTSLNKDIALRDGIGRRPHPRSDPRSLGHRRRGAEPAAPPRRARRHPQLG
jgi:DNA segregation ATPase FtsK/SpoIIIE-like protein